MISIYQGLQESCRSQVHSSPLTSQWNCKPRPPSTRVRVEAVSPFLIGRIYGSIHLGPVEACGPGWPFSLPEESGPEPTDRVWFGPGPLRFGVGSDPCHGQPVRILRVK